MFLDFWVQATPPTPPDNTTNCCWKCKWLAGAADQLDRLQQAYQNFIPCSTGPLSQQVLEHHKLWMGFLELCMVVQVWHVVPLHVHRLGFKAISMCTTSLLHILASRLRPLEDQ